MHLALVGDEPCEDDHPAPQDAEQIPDNLGERACIEPERDRESKGDVERCGSREDSPQGKTADSPR